jgi:hypothetical protein
MRRTVGAVGVGLAGVVLALGACGGSGSGQPGTTAPAAAAPAAPALETRWLRGLWANDIREALGTVGLTCTGPHLENRTNVWMCESATPLVRYQVRFYGGAPGKIEYINAVVTQSGPAKDALPLRLFDVLAGLRFDGGDRAKAREWLGATLATGGATVIGPAKYKLAGDPSRRTLDLKASGSDW